jgi:hypothetical protein
VLNIFKIVSVLTFLKMVLLIVPKLYKFCQFKFYIIEKIGKIYYNLNK